MDAGKLAIALDDRAADWRWTRGYVENVAEAIALAVTDDRAERQIYNVGEEDALSLADWVRAIAHAAGWPGEVIEKPRDELPAELVKNLAFEQSLVADTTRFRRELGYAERVSRHEGLRRSVAWERAHPQSGAFAPDHAGA
jgi:nucleoside-diphosphate-sugar epimerase